MRVILIENFCFAFIDNIYTIDDIVLCNNHLLGFKANIGKEFCKLVKRDTGFYSSSGLRTASVKAITPLTAIRLEIVHFKKFLITHQHLSEDMLAAADNMLRQQFIKQVEPFQKIEPELLKEMAAQLEKLQVPAGEVIIKQDTIADHCYVLRSGTIEIVLTKADGKTIILNTLDNPGTLFGETALLTNNTRNASVIAVAECKLYTISREQFQKLTQSLDISASLTELMMDRHRPIPVQGVTVHKRQTAEQETIVILKEAKHGIYFKTSEEGLFIWNLLNGDLTIIDIAAQYYYKYKVLAVDSIASFIMQLMRAGLVEMPTLATYVQKEKHPFWIRLVHKAEAILTWSYSIREVDEKLTNLYNRIGYLFYTKLAHIIMLCVTLMGFIAFILLLPQLEHILNKTPNAWLYLLWAIPVNMSLIPIHELAHALTTKAYGHHVNRMGIGWFWLGPMAFTDTSDMWLSTKWPRIAVAFAGVYANAILSSILIGIAWLCLPYFPHVALFIWLVAFSSYMMAFYNLDPTFELDGYYILMNYFDTPNLRGKATFWLVEKSKHTLLHPHLARQYIPEITYWLSTIFCIFLFAATGYLTYIYIFHNVLPHKVGGIDTTILRWLIPAAAIVISFTGIYFRIKRERNARWYHEK